MEGLLCAKAKLHGSLFVQMSLCTIYTIYIDVTYEQMCFRPSQVCTTY